MAGSGNSISHYIIDPSMQEQGHYRRDYYRRAFATKSSSTKTSSGSSTQTQSQTNTNTGSTTGGSGGNTWQNNTSKTTNPSQTPCDIPGQSCPTVGALGGTSNWCVCTAGSGGGGGSTSGTSTTPSSTPAPSSGGGGGGGTGILGGLFNSVCGSCGGSAGLARISAANLARAFASKSSSTTTTTGGGAGGGGGNTSCNSGAPNCSCTANSGSGNSPGWYTPGANAASGSGWGGAPGHHHCSVAQSFPNGCCFCTDVSKCGAGSGSNAAVLPGSCRPDWGTAGYVQAGGPYPATADFSKCAPGSAPTAGSTSGGTTSTTSTTTPTDTSSTTPTTPAPSGGGGSCIPFICNSQSNFNLVVIGLVILMVLVMFKVIK